MQLWLLIQTPFVLATFFISRGFMPAHSNPVMLISAVLLVITGFVTALIAEDNDEPEHRVWALGLMVPLINIGLVVFTDSEPLAAIGIPGFTLYIVIALWWSLRSTPTPSRR